MAKAQRFVIPFVSIEGQKYNIYIYKEGYIGRPQELLAGDTPFVTDEDASNDVFSPIRAQSGSIQICTRDKYGAEVDINSILPANNLDCPVKVFSMDANNVETIEWQGFLSCEAYSQNYTDVPEIITLPLIGVLEAMDGVAMNQTRTNGIKKANAIMYDILNEIAIQSGISCFTHVNYSANAWQIFTKYIDASSLFTENDNDSVNYTTKVLQGLSAKEALNRLCQFMGWTARESGTEVYFERIGETVGMYRETLSNFGGNSFHPTGITPTAITEQDINDLHWRGDNHKFDIRQGARSVKVEAGLEDMGFGIELPGFPVGDILPDGSPRHVYFSGNTLDGVRVPEMYTFFNNNDQAYPNISYGFHTATYVWSSDHQQQTATYAGTTTKANAMQNNILWSQGWGGFFQSKNGGAFFVEHADRTEHGSHDNDPYYEGLYCSFLPRVIGNYPIFSISTQKQYNFQQGRLKISLDLARVFYENYDPDNQGTFGDNKGEFEKDMYFVLRVGNKYFDGVDWYDTWHSMQVIFWGTKFEYECDIPQYMEGDVELQILAGTGAHASILFLDAIVESIKIEYEYVTSKLKNKRSSNNYFQVLQTNFRDEISISTSYVSYMNNMPSPSIIMNSQNEFMQELVYDEPEGVQISSRPESDLLSRLAAYYGAKRKTLDLVVKHPTDAPLPLLKLNGIDDGKVYLPLSESRDWQLNVCQLTCFEVPEEQSES